MKASTELKADVLVFGDSPCGRQLIMNLDALGVSMIAASSDEDAHGNASRPTLTPVAGAQPIQVVGGPGDFQVLLENGEKRFHAAVKQVVIANDGPRVPRFNSYGLIPGDAVRTLSEVASPEAAVATGTVVFLVGLGLDSNPAETRQAMSTALAWHADHRGSAYLLTGNLKVADDGLEALYREAKTAGVTFIKFTQTRPEITQDQNGRVTVIFEDEISRETFRLAPDLVVVDEDRSPAPALGPIASTFRLHKDGRGFLQKENVHREGIFTNRRGVYAVGPARGHFTDGDQQLDADATALVIARFLHGGEDNRLPAAEINRGQCVKCLTCYRSCPYAAIRLGDRPVIMPAACEGCGICKAECPREAIGLASLEPDHLAGQMSAAPSNEATLHIVAFCCTRSAAPALRMAGTMGLEMPAGLTLVEVPCAGGISSRHLLTALERGVDGVLVLTCHTDNCHSENGNRLASNRVSALQALMTAMGIDPVRFAVHTLANNMGAEVARLVNDFAAALKDMDPINPTLG